MGQQLARRSSRSPRWDSARAWTRTRATWSPDGQYLLLMAWGHPPDAPSTFEDPFFLVVPVDSTRPAVVLFRGSALVAYEGYDDTTWVPIQTWARATSD